MRRFFLAVFLFFGMVLGFGSAIGSAFHHGHHNLNGPRCGHSAAQGHHGWHQPAAPEAP